MAMAMDDDGADDGADDGTGTGASASADDGASRTHRRQRQWTMPALPITTGMPILAMLILAESFRGVVSLPTIIKNDAVRKMDGVPVLGRGYSATTNSFQSSCLDISMDGTVTDQSYNYDYYFTDFTREINGDLETQLAGKISQSFGYGRVKAVAAETIAFNQNVQKDPTKPHLFYVKKYNLIVTMRVEKFFTSLLDHKATLSPDATKMLLEEEYINFFMTCGPSYVHSIHRAQEVTAIFSYEAIDLQTAQAFADSVRLLIYGNENSKYQGELIGDRSRPPVTTDTGGRSNHGREEVEKFRENDDILNSLSIEVLGYGLGLNKLGSTNLVATTLVEFNEVMKYALDSMTKMNDGNDKDQIGMIYRIKVVPWADNAEFLNFAGVDYNRIMVPVPRRLIENSRNVTIEGDGTNGTTMTNETSFVCRKPQLEPDDFGKCCRPDCLVTITITTNEENENGEKGVTMKKRCEPKQYLSPVMMNNNLETNAEFVARLAAVVRDKMNTLSTFSQCATALRTFPERFDYYFLNSADNAKYDHAIEMAFTLKELKTALDPVGDLSILQMVSNEHDEFFEMFYQPCLSALYGMNIGLDKYTDPKYFMAEPWYNHEECAQTSCLELNSAWDRKNGNGCIPGILERRNTKTPIPSDDDPFCAVSINVTNGQEGCKYKPGEDSFNQIDVCRESLPQGRNSVGESTPVSMAYLIDYFCMPRLAADGYRANATKMDSADNTLAVCSTGLRYPFCEIEDLSEVGDGFCENDYNSKDCGWDGGDCEQFNDLVPDCSVGLPYLLGNGFCDGTEYNTYNCGWDLGDCDEFNRKYPNCDVKHPFLVGNGFCDGGIYNTAPCGYDGGDCHEINRVEK